ncbi:glycosyl hydrolase family 76 [Arcticibacter tournemirensis]|nr:glycoside hydrolase family 76 protein [Arcticibacter tournemirensis]TQM49228.1 glycosyl hydrolase family 76 [Arcticibacter tournemirensis]
MNKYKNPMISFFYCLTVVVMSFFSSCNEADDDKPYTPDYDVVPQYTAADVDTAFNAFNRHLFDPTRKLYYRDSGKPTAVGAIWTQAVYWDMAMNAYKRTKSPQHRQLIEDIYTGCGNYYANYDWNTKPQVWFIYDDIMWWVISMARAYEITGEQKYLDHSISGFHRVWYGAPGIDNGSYDAVNGGMLWDWHDAAKGKMSCINYPTVIAAMTLYNITKNADYLSKAKEIYQWSHDNLFDSRTGRVADSKHGGNSPNWTTHTYNQATCIGAAVMLYKETGEQRYLDDAVLTADYTKNTMSGKLQILPYEGGEEQGIYHAILGQYMIRLIEDCNKPEYLPWLRRSINYGWKNRDAVRKLTTKNFIAPTPSNEPISCYDASGVVALMQVCPPESK